MKSESDLSVLLAQELAEWMIYGDEKSKEPLKRYMLNPPVCDNFFGDVVKKEGYGLYVEHELMVHQFFSCFSDKLNVLATDELRSGDDTELISRATIYENTLGNHFLVCLNMSWYAIPEHVVSNMFVVNIIE